MNDIFLELDEIFGKDNYALGGSLALKHQQLYHALDDDRTVNDIDLVVFDNSCYRYGESNAWIKLFDNYRINYDCNSGSFYDYHGNKVQCFSIQLHVSGKFVDVMTFANSEICKWFKQNCVHDLQDKFLCRYVQKASVILAAKQQLLDMNMLSFKNIGDNKPYETAVDYDKHYKDIIAMQNKGILEALRNAEHDTRMEVLPVILRN